MNDDTLDDLLARLTGGDAQAAEEVFRAYEPYLRIVVRRQLPASLRAKFDSGDVLQSVWADLLRGFRQGDWQFATTAQLRGFLLRVTRNRLIDRRRRFGKALAHERPLAAPGERGPTCKQPRPSEVAQADDLWQRMLALCPPAHHEVLRLKRQGLSLAEVASRTGLHEGSVRRILRQLARQLAEEQALALAADGVM
jgi:RNA polymerase sigma-70 factor (ECF subfamily)